MNFFCLILIVTCIQADENRRLDWDSNRPSIASEFYPAAGLVVAIDPDQLFGEGLIRSWRNVDACHKNLRIQSRPISKVNFVINPVPSIDGAIAEIDLQGSSAGRTYSSNEKVEVESDTLTKFTAKQTIHISPEGIAFSTPELQVKTNHSFNRAKATSHGGVSAFLAGFAYKKFPRDLHCRAQPFARDQVKRQLTASMENLNQTLFDAVQRLGQEQPWLSRLPWHFESSSNKIFLTSFSENSHKTVREEKNNAPISIAIHSTILDEVFQQIANQEISSAQIQAKLKKRKSTLPETSQDEDAKPWSVGFSEPPVRFEFRDNVIVAQLFISKFVTEKQTIGKTTVRLLYSIEKIGRHWRLSRRGDIGIQSHSSGARQQIVRSVIKQRLERVIPDTIPFPHHLLSPGDNPMNLELSIKNIVAKNNSVFVSIDHR